MFIIFYNHSKILKLKNQVLKLRFQIQLIIHHFFAKMVKVLQYSRELDLKAKIIEYALEALQGELGIMQSTLHEVELEHNALCEQLGMIQRRIEVFKCQATHKQ
jgi:hypothetical protein